MDSLASTDLRWRALLADFRRGGFTHAAFCRQREISIHSFRKRLYGQKPIAPAAATPPRPIRFLPVHLPTTLQAPVIPSAVEPLALVLPDGLRVLVGSGFDPDTLRRLLDALETRP